jgi:alkaline phosphatase
LGNVSVSAERFARDYYHKIQAGESEQDLLVWMQGAVKEKLGIHDASTEEISVLIEKPALAPYMFADMVSRRAQAGWSTHGHSGKSSLCR